MNFCFKTFVNIYHMRKSNKILKQLLIHIRIIIINPLHVNANNMSNEKQLCFFKKLVRRVTLVLYFLQISLMSDLIEDNWILLAVSTFRLLELLRWSTSTKI